ncbi:MAG: hypothetical protein HQL84_06300 [Magnetococcales bacterium]|nr:hypothetical protein [Magnetococcales bacterium]MBF0149643.1 hypothetical protein [Magnetococcales bacterium]MBF0172489.1 hypothetical protein [Magnetococcales bacterium]MBF0349232.1 hypothetical protein [Magnetococcales bacterium]MBF0631786.1 hypothetical protein [Magnetococcales bacterium]
MESQSELISWTLLILGSVMTLFGLVRIVANGFAMVLWAVMLVLGLMAVEYGLGTPPAALARLGISSDILHRTGGLVQPGKDLSEAALVDLCRRVQPTAPVGRDQ